jgi:hypothetical protein
MKKIRLTKALKKAGWTKAKLAKQQKINENGAILGEAFDHVLKAYLLIKPKKKPLGIAYNSLHQCIDDISECYLKYLGYK